MANVDICGVSDSRSAEAAGRIINEKGGQWLVVSPSLAGASRMASDLSFFVKKKIYLLPYDQETFIGYEAKNRDALTGRLRVMKALLDDEDCVICAPAQAAICKLPPAQTMRSQMFTISDDDEISLKEVTSKLVDMGYERVPLVYAAGQFSLRGDILDIFTPYGEAPFRIELFDTDVESIRTFDPVSQRSVEKVTGLTVAPATLIVREKESFSRAKEGIGKAYRRLPERRDELLDLIENFSSTQHLENYLDYFYEHPQHIWDYMKNDGRIIVDDPNRSWENLKANGQELEADFEVYMEKGLVVAADFEKQPGVADLEEMYRAGDTWFLTPFARNIKGVEQLDELKNVTSRQTLSYNGKLEILEKDLHRYLDNAYKVTIVCSTEDRMRNMKEYLSHIGLRQQIWVKGGNLSGGMDLPDEKICYITDGDIFGTYKRKRRRRRAGSENTEAIKSFSEIRKGDFVVHEAHGIGKYEGLEQLTVAGEVRDYLKVKYAGNDMLYVPADQMHLIQKYVGADSTAPKINKLSGSEWRTTKAKARASVASMAKELLELSAERAAAPGYAFEPDTVWQKEFEDSFPYEETPDQLRCIEEIKRDMEKPEVMDRLLCGDVGYGKTEVAARAMFKCAAEGRQVAMLVPTTVLASQHYHTLTERFAKFPFTIDVVSRFRTPAEQKKTIEGLKKGTVDIVIGTHRLLSSDVAFKDLGLLVVDEEQRFGVAHKEKIKKMRKNVDVLTLSATPIPRTLHLSLLGIRDMSLLEEPPEERYPVQTYVLEEDDHVIREAIERELDRGGQVYVIHNRVNGIHRIADKIDKLVPGRRIVVCHGRMSETALEDSMMAFVNGEADILVATTIIENGIDIPNVNTVIVIDADKFGLSQLYQLRGRVGRSTRLAYAYLMHRPGKVLSEVAEKRLKAIKDFTEFGAGFKIAMRDLEIRGAGNLLGREQHGHMVNVGYELYSKMVDDAVRALRGETVRSEDKEATIDMKLPAYIPDWYIHDEEVKLSMYKKIAAVSSEEDQKAMMEELDDRFGSVPAETRNLMLVSRIRTLAEELDVRKVIIQKKRAVLNYDKKLKMRPQAIFLESGGNPLDELLDVMTVMIR
ncbi:MAG: transcription-repair coupling factor [Anaerovoracaceae bacterium]|jgi:transcription-repair coupling factor (superfamily II helicase)